MMYNYELSGSFVSMQLKMAAFSFRRRFFFFLQTLFLISWNHSNFIIKGPIESLKSDNRMLISWFSQLVLRYIYPYTI